MELYYQKKSGTTRKTILFLHGFTGTHATFTKIGSFFPEYHLLMPDLPGHGKSANLPLEQFRMKQTVTQLKELLDLEKVAQVIIIGYSMGGRIGIGFASAYPEYVEKLILLGSSPGLKTEEERKLRQLSDENLARRITEIGVAAFIKEWEKLPLFDTQKKLTAFQRDEIKQERLKQNANGLAQSLQQIGTGKQPSYWEKLGKFTFPVLLLTGELDHKFTNIAITMLPLLAKGEHWMIAGAGHAVHLEKPELVTKYIHNWLNRLNKEENNMTISWETAKKYQEIKYETFDGMAKITINRPEVHNAFTPKTVMEMIDAFSLARDDEKIGVIILTGEGEKAFCSGGDQKVRGHGGYVGDDQIPRLNVLDLQRLIRVIPKPVIAMVAGWSIGGGNVLQLVCDITIAASNAKFGQTGPNVGSFDAGYGSGYLARVIGHKKAKEVWFMCRQYSAEEALDMGWINAVVPISELESETVAWAKEMLKKSPTALRFIKAAFNADTDGLAGIQQLAGDATLLYYTTDEAKEGRDAFKEKRDPDFDQFPKFP